MSARVFQSTASRVLTRQRQRVLAGSCLGLSVGTGLAMRSSPRIRFDSPAAASSPFSTSSPALSGAPGPRDTKEEVLNPELMKQLSGGSVTGFLLGVLVSVFSRTLVLLLGVGVVIVQVAAQYGINLVDQLRLKQRLGKSRVLAALEKDPAFKLSFGIFFALSAFMQF
ncbi:hypothetical protein F5B22DRAFT_154244 [Xylaria bambusicola]|uniref:uncharacterized protein n=1 Tax=Xylaria bambusicola TaxID=326684 RepID=UPI002007C33F|nr:uncharacterized protein F5B22DRAFT_154244 [Xylaria bambusicola]KAI0526347.1 hypothetical protein F5B22DRAFT_154244 [Xylaria bambusicola]